MSSNELFHSSSNSKLQKLIFCLSGIGWGIGMGVQVWVGLLLSEIKSEWGLSYTTEVIVPISLMSGMFIGSYFWGIISDKYGRMISYKQTMIFIAIGLILGTFALDVWMLSISFAITGFGIGGCFTVDGTVFIEHASAEKGHLLITLNIFGPIFSAVPPLLSYIYSNSTFGTWRSVQGTLGLISLILALPRFWIKETPMYLNLKMQSQLQPVNINSESFISESNQITLTEMLIILFKRPLKTFTILYIIIFAGINFSFSGINSFLPEILKRAHLEASKTQIYELIFFDQISKIYTVGLPAVVLSTYLVKGSMGRKLTYSLSLLFAAVFVFAFIIPDQFSVVFI